MSDVDGEFNPVEEALASGDEEHHLEAAAVADEEVGKAMSIISVSLNLVAVVIEENPQGWDTSFPNDVATLASLSRAVRSIRAATHLLWVGYPQEAQALLRLAYEAASLGRVLAHDPDAAKNWLVDLHTWPDSRVRRWIRENKNKDHAHDLQLAYSELSTFAHPTPGSCLSQMDLNDDGPRVRLRSKFDEPQFQNLLWHIGSTALLVLFSTKDASADNGDALPSWWHQAVANLADSWAEWRNSDLAVDHLRRYADDHERRFEGLDERLQDIADLDHHLDSHPRSWRNLRNDDNSPQQ